MATASKAKKKTVRIASGRKRARQDVKLNAANTALRSKFRTVDQERAEGCRAGDKAKATELFKSAQPVIDSVADKGLFHKNKAARHKSRLAAKVKALRRRLRAHCPGREQRARSCGPFSFQPRRSGGSSAGSASLTCSSLSRAKFITKSQAIGSMLAQRLVDDHALHAVDHRGTQYGE